MLLAPAKVNLTLEVLSRHADGYHGVRSVMVPVALFDRIAVEPAAATTISSNVPGLAAPGNLILRALAATNCGPVRVILEKAIPAGAGLGGGSSDAAAVLRAAMDGTIDRGGDSIDWIAVARSLGSDVPFFLAGTAALVEGTGERVTPLGAMPPWWCLIAYRMLDHARQAAPAAVRPRKNSASWRAAEALQRADFDTVCGAVANDFQDVVLDAFPAVAGAHAALEIASGRRALLSGSGSCVFALFETEREACDARARLPSDAAARSFAVPLHADAGWRGEARGA
jgi:4-diphosphocytidyl-2-C-methyl-D-erythritol kinase